jgi:hypothetical protein
MRDLVTMARRLFETRRTVKALERTAADAGSLNPLDAARLLVFRGALQALAWTLEIDLDQMDAPPMHNLAEQPTRVCLHRVDLDGGRILWLTEIPAHHDEQGDAGYSTEPWSCFLSDGQARDLHRALGETLDDGFSFAMPALTLPQLRPAQRPASGLRLMDPPVGPLQPDIEGGYGGLGGPRMPPPPPAAAAGAPRSPISPKGA